MERLSLGYRLLLLVLSFALPLNILNLVSIVYPSRSALDAQNTNLLYSGRPTATAVKPELDAYVVLAEVLALSPVLLGDDLKAFEIEARRAMPSLDGAWVFVADAQGRMLLNP